MINQPSPTPQTLAQTLAQILTQTLGFSLSILCLLGVLFPLTSSAAPLPPAGDPLTIEQCVLVALEHNASIEEAQGKVAEYQARLSEIEAIYYPKLQMLGYAAPMFTVTGDTTSFERKWKSPSDWGPYLHLEAQFTQVLYTFGRAEHGEDAAAAMAKVEAAKLREAKLVVALEVRRLAQLYLYTQSLQITLNNGREIITSALSTAHEKYDEGSGDVTMADVMKLEYFSIMLESLQLDADAGAEISFAALKHTMGLPEDHTLELSRSRLSKKFSFSEPTLPELIQESSKKRPEWAQLSHGAAAVAHLIEAERLADAPAIFLGGTFGADWAPTRDDQDNPYVLDPYNQLMGGAAVGFLWDYDPAKSSAKVDQAVAIKAQVEALKRFADTGIPLRVKKAHGDSTLFKAKAKLAKKAVKAGRKWMIFSGTAFGTGVGEAQDVLEGAAAYLEANANYYEALKNYHVAQAELDFAVGRLPEQEN